jgi:DNA gyrase/topoisomerase IV subunit B
VGASVVNALSEKMQVWVHKDGKVYTQSYKIGVPDGQVAPTGEKTSKHGTIVRFWPDATMFTTTVFDYDTIKYSSSTTGIPNERYHYHTFNEFEDTAYRFFFEEVLNHMYIISIVR